MPPKVLRHCSICKGWGAMYVEQDEKLGKLILCHKCWTHRQSKKPVGSSQPDAKKDPTAPVEPPDPTNKG